MIVTRRMTLTALVLAALCWTASSSWAIDTRLLPEKTEVVLTINIKQILKSELAKSKSVQDLIKDIKAGVNQVPNSDLALKYLEKMGLDPTKDLGRLIIAHPASQTPEDVVVILEGNFNPAKIEATAREAVKDFGNFLTITKFNDITMLEIAQDGKGAYIGLLGNKTIVATGSKAALKEAITRSLAKKPSVLKKDVEDLLKTVNEEQSISFVASSRAMADVGKAIGAIGPAIPVLDGGLSGSVTFSKEVNFQLGLAAKDQATARDLVDQGNLGLFVARAFLGQQAQQNPQLAPLIDVANTLRLFNVGNNAVLTGEVSYESLQQLFKNIKSAF